MEQPVKRKEMWGHATICVGQNLIFGLWAQIMLFFTDGLMIPVAAAGTIVALTRVWDGINDPMMGMIADRTRSRWGRYRPWVLWMTIPVGALVVLSFTAPDFSMTGKIVFAAVVYVLTSMAYTSIDVPFWSMPAAMTTDSGKRTQIISLSKTMGVIAMLGVTIAVPPLVSKIGGMTDAGTVNYVKGFFPIGVGVAVLGIICSLLGFGLVREHVEPIPQEKVTLKKSFSVITQNKPLILIIVSSILSNMLLNLRAGLGSYYAIVNLGNYMLSSVLTLISLPALLIGMVAAPAIAKRVGKKKLFIGANLFGAVMNVVLFFVGYESFTIFSIVCAIASLSQGITQVLTSSMIADTIEYAEWKTGQRRDALISSTQTLISKFTMAASGLTVSLTLSIAGYAANSATQTPAVYSTFHFCYTLMMALGCILAIIPMLSYPLTEKRHAEIVAELAVRHAKDKENAHD